MPTLKNPKYELEIYPQLISLICWGELIDNDAAKASMIAGRAATSVGSQLVNSFVTKEIGLQIKPWFARVPTSSNIADDPSRLSEDAVVALGSVKRVVVHVARRRIFDGQLRSQSEWGRLRVDNTQIRSHCMCEKSSCVIGFVLLLNL